MTMTTTEKRQTWEETHLDTVEEKKLQTCCECGKTGTDMTKLCGYVGGVGMVDTFHCSDCMAKTERESRAAVEALRVAMMRLGN